MPASYFSTLREYFEIGALLITPLLLLIEAIFPDKKP